MKVISGYGRLRGRGSWAVVCGADVLMNDRWSARDVIELTVRGEPPPVQCESVPLESAEWAMPLADGARILCVGVNYQGHLEELGRPRPEHPSLFVRWASSLVDPGSDVLRPSRSQRFDYEGEIAVVIGGAIRHAPKGTGLRHIVGYTCFGDHSARDWQEHSAQVTAGKNFESSGSIGPYVRALREDEGLDGLRLTTRVNGEIRQAASLADLLFSPGELVEYVSAFTMLRAGDVIATGTPAGIGMARRPPVYLAAGDVVEIAAGDVMTLVNRVTDEDAARAAFD